MNLIVLVSLINILKNALKNIMNELNFDHPNFNLKLF